MTCWLPCDIIIAAANLPGGFRFREEVVDMSTYETLSLMIAFGVLIIMISGTKK